MLSLNPASAFMRSFCPMSECMAMTRASLFSFSMEQTVSASLRVRVKIMSDWWSVFLMRARRRSSRWSMDTG